jgi:hypothetical protein
VIIMVQLSIFQPTERHLHLHMRYACSRQEQAVCSSTVDSATVPALPPCRNSSQPTPQSVFDCGS